MTCDDNRDLLAPKPTDPAIRRCGQGSKDVSNKQATTPNLAPDRWAYLKALRVGRGRMFHTGSTYDVGRNKAKRERRAMFWVRK